MRAHGVYIRIQWSKWRWDWRGLVVSEFRERRLMKLGSMETLTAGLGRSHCNRGLGLPCHQSCWSVAGPALGTCSWFLPKHALRTAAAQGWRCF